MLKGAKARDGIKHPIARTVDLSRVLKVDVQTVAPTGRKLR